MRMRTKVITFLIAGAIASGGGTVPAFAATHSSPCGTTKSSAGVAYGGQGSEISQVACDNDGSTPPSSPSDSSALPFTGLDVGLLVAAGAVLVAAGMVLRLRLRHGGQ